MRVLFLVDGDRHAPSARLRATALVPSLARLGAEARVLHAPERSGLAGRCRLLAALRAADVVVLSRLTPQRLPLAVIRSLARVLVWDVDDAIHTLPGRADDVDRVLRVADAVIASTRELAALLPRPGAAVIPTPVVVDGHPVRRHEPVRQPVVVWRGTAGTLPSLDVVHPLLARLAARGVPFRLRVIGSAFPAWDDVLLERVRWSPATADRDLAAADVAIVPRSTSAWDTAKTALKAVEAMAAGLPVVASPVGALNEAVVPGETGFLARATEEWEGALEMLLADAALRGRMGAAGRRRALAGYSVDVVAAQLRDVLAPLAVSVNSAA